mmetsp:Transcript_2410/g.3870  ORF Transcript_2410/g.3870 Transcript_2410/m.3870 type:complete len:249 (-) Transcript_2410:663-1409(-)
MWSPTCNLGTAVVTLAVPLSLAAGLVPLGGQTSAGSHDVLVSGECPCGPEGEVLHRPAVGLATAAETSTVLEGAALLLHLLGKVDLNQGGGPDAESHHSECIDDGEEEEDVAQEVQAQVDEEDELGHQLRGGGRSEEVLDVGLHESVEKVEQESNQEVLVREVPENWDGMTPELARDHGNLGDVLDRPAVLAGGELAGSEARRLLLLGDDALACDTKLPHAVVATAEEKLPPSGSHGLLLVEEHFLTL